MSVSVRATASFGLPLFLERMLERLPAGAYTCDADGLITWFNDAAVRIWGREPKLGDPADRYCGSFRLFDPVGAPIAHADCWMALALRHERSYEGREIVIEREDGVRVPVLAHASPIQDDAGRLLGAVNVLVDVSAQKRVEDELRRSQRTLDDFFENAAVGLHWVDCDGIVLRANQAELDMLGYERDEYVGRPIADFHVDADVIADMLRRLEAGETLRDFEARMRRKDGEIRTVRVSSNALRENGRLVHTRCFTLDVTEQKRAEELLRTADRRKDEFLAMLAHELRNPLAPIRNAVELLRLVGPPERALEEARDLIDRQVTQLSRIVDDLLDVARITRGQLGIRPERVELDAVVKSAIETARPMIDEKGHELSVELPEEPVPLDADPVRLAQVFLNLLSNAARYTPPGGRIELHARRSDGPERRVEVTVRDDGRGLAPPDLDRVFEMFVQGRGAREGDRSDGLGIGLTLVRAIAELHGGSVRARSAGPGEGSEFTVELPVASGAARPHSAAPPPQTRDEGRRVLIVDDNVDVAASLAALLERVGHEVRTAHGGAEGVEEAERFRPDAILMDIGLPDLDGYEACRRIRERSWARGALLVAVTGWGAEEHRRRAREAGFDEHLTKPVSPRVVRDLLANSS